jgi:hypothetical protein
MEQGERPWIDKATAGPRTVLWGVTSSVCVCVCVCVCRRGVLTLNVSVTVTVVVGTVYYS